MGLTDGTIGFTGGTIGVFFCAFAGFVKSAAILTARMVVRFLIGRGHCREHTICQHRSAPKATSKLPPADNPRTLASEHMKSAAIALIASLAASAFADSLTENEPLFFVGETRQTATARLLRIPSATPQITSSSRETKYEPGRDFAWQPGSRHLTLTPESRIPFTTPAALHPQPNSPNAYAAQRDTGAWMLYGPGHLMHDLQSAATYQSDDDWKVPPIQLAPDMQLGPLRQKLNAKQPVKVVMLGDSISTEADASAIAHVPPNQPGYPTLLVRALEEKFGAKITLTNLSKGGMDSKWGTTRVPDVIAEKPDLLLLAFGMNDASGHRKPDEFAAFTRQMFEPVRAALLDCTIILISSMTANPEWNHSAPEIYPLYAQELAKLVGPGIAFADVTTRWEHISARKKHMDLSGNGLNHPNDYGHRIYADVILRMITAID